MLSNQRTKLSVELDYFKGTEMNWNDSKNFCENEGSRLITVQNQNEFDLLQNISTIFGLNVFHVNIYQKFYLKLKQKFIINIL